MTIIDNGKRGSTGDMTAPGAAAVTGHPAANLALDAVGLTRDYGNGKGLFDFGLSVPCSSVISMIGANGSGKSTALRCLAFIESPDQGVIRVNGQTCFNQGSGKAACGDVETVGQIRGRTVGAVLQGYEPWAHMDVLHNVMLPVRHALALPLPAARAAAEQALDSFGLLDRASDSPGGLSGGLRQRVMLARAFALRPKILLLDEATSALDPEWTQRVREMLRRFAEQGGAVIIVSHQLGLVRRLSDRVAFLDGGRLVEEGDPERVFEKPQSERLKVLIENG